MRDAPKLHSIVDAAEQAGAAGDWASAEELLRQAVNAQEAQLGPVHPELANTLNNLGVVCERTGKLDEAEQCYRRAYSIATAVLPPTDPFVVTSGQNLRDFCEARGSPFALTPAPPTVAAQPEAGVHREAQPTPGHEAYRVHPANLLPVSRSRSVWRSPY
jgi:tetratricopeptide (TPR) repeat protein